MFFIWYFIYGQSFNVISLFLLRISNKMCFEFLFRQLMMPWTLRFIFDHLPKQWPTCRKRGKERITKNYFENKTSFLDEIKSIFHSFWMVIIWWKNKNLMKIVGKNFKWIQADAFQNNINDVDTRVLQINYAMNYQCQQHSKVQSAL